MLEERAAAAGLSNVRGVAARIEEGGVECDAVVALHACGAASDLAIAQAVLTPSPNPNPSPNPSPSPNPNQAVARRAPFIVCPCCVGKLAQRPKGTPKGAPKGAPKESGDANGEGEAPPEGWNNGKGWVEAAPGGADSRQGGGSLSPPAELLELPRSPWLREQGVGAYVTSSSPLADVEACVGNPRREASANSASSLQPRPASVNWQMASGWPRPTVPSFPT